MCVYMCVSVVDCLGSYKRSEAPSRSIPQAMKGGCIHAKQR